jgi:predicted small metal-binding protein
VVDPRERTPGTASPYFRYGDGRSRLRPPILTTRRPYDVTVKQIDCVCGCVVKGEDDDELWEKAQEHLRADHPELAGKVSRKDILAQAEET